MEKRPGLGRKEDASCEPDVVDVEDVGDVVDVVDRGHITISLSKILPAAVQGTSHCCLPVTPRSVQLPIRACQR